VRSRRPTARTSGREPLAEKDKQNVSREDSGLNLQIFLFLVNFGTVSGTIIGALHRWPEFTKATLEDTGATVGGAHRCRNRRSLPRSRRREAGDRAATDPHAWQFLSGNAVATSSRSAMVRTSIQAYGTATTTLANRSRIFATADGSAAHLNFCKNFHDPFISARSCRRPAIALRVYVPWRKALRLPRGAPDPAAPPCILHRCLHRTAGDLQGCPDRVFAPQRALASIGPVLRRW